MPRRFTIGRDRASDIAIADDSVSRVHAEIWLEDDGTLMLADHGSSNGTELIRAGEASPLSTATVAPGDHVRFGAVTLAVKDLIDAIELKHPGALTRSPHAEMPPQKPAPPSPPPLPRQPAAPPPLPPAANVAPPPLPPRLPPVPPAVPPPDHQQALRPVAPPLPERAVAPQRPEPAAGAALVRCECGAIKRLGETCPTCHR